MNRRKSPRHHVAAAGLLGDEPQRGVPSAADGPIRDHVRAVLAAIGEDPAREGLEKTPERVEKSFRFLTQGYAQDIGALLTQALFTVDYDEMVIIKDIDVFSMCEHHLLPFFGRAHVAYLPKGKVIGLSKIPRLVDAFARRLQVQERLTSRIADTLWERLGPEGVGVVLEATHTCMTMRGVRKPGSVMVTSAVRGTFKARAETRAEFMKLIGR